MNGIALAALILGGGILLSRSRAAPSAAGPELPPYAGPSWWKDSPSPAAPASLVPGAHAQLVLLAGGALVVQILRGVNGTGLARGEVISAPSNPAMLGQTVDFTPAQAALLLGH